MEIFSFNILERGVCFLVFLDKLKKIVYFKLNVGSKVYIASLWATGSPNHARLNKRE